MIRTLSGSQLPVVEDDSGFHVIVPHLETYACLALRQ